MSSLKKSASDDGFNRTNSDAEQIVVAEAVGLPYGTQVSPSKGIRFWMVFVALCVSVFLSALEFVRAVCSLPKYSKLILLSQTAVSTALPTIVHDLNGDDFVWVASAYALASTALLTYIKR